MTTRGSTSKKRGGRGDSPSPKPATKKSPTKLNANDVPSSKRGGLVGVGLLLVGVLTGLGMYIDAAGPVGRFLEAVFQGLVGSIAVLTPLVLIVVGVARLLSHEPAHHEPQWHGEESDLQHRRVLLGVLLIVVAIDGLLHLVWGPRPGDGIALDDLHKAGGAIGLVVTAPGQALLGVWGAAFILVVLGLAGGLELSGISASRATRWVLDQARRAIGAIRGWLTWLTTISESRDASSDHSHESSLGGNETVIDLVKPQWRTDDQAQTDSDATSVAEPATAITISLPPSLSDESTVVEQDDDTELAIGLGSGESDGASTWTLPSLSILARSESAEIDVELVEEGGRALERALEAHGVATRLVGMTVGPTVTRYELELGEGVKVARVTSLHKDIAYAMASPDVRILAPIPGRSAIGVEVPNRQRQLVALGDILSSDEARKATHPCEVALGRDISGRAVMANLAEMPHILIAGATGAGKSSCINSLLTSLLMRSTPDQVRLILVDPKRVELGQYNHLPHLLTEVVVNPKKAANALSWAVKEMERRYDLLSEAGVRDITGYNQALDAGELRTEARVEGVEDPGEQIYSRLPFIVIVIDELNDLMMVAARDVEDSICRIAQMARAVGIHLVIATQRPSVNVITGVIKANVPARLAFAVSSLADSRVILDQGGAERLIGQGDMLLLGASSSIPRRIQGAWVGEDEVREVVAHWKAQSPEIVYDKAVVPEGDQPDLMGGYGSGDSGGDDDASLLWQAMELVVRSQLGSTSMLQRKLRVGFARAGRLMDLLEMRGVVGPSTGSKARDVLMTVEELDELLAGKD